MSRCLVSTMIFTVTLRPVILKSTRHIQILSSSRFLAQNILRLPNRTPSYIFSARHFSGDGDISPSVEAALKQRDKIPTDYRIIYRAPLYNQITVSYALTMLALAAAPIVVALAYYEDNSYPIKVPGYDDFYIFETPLQSYLVSFCLLCIIMNVVVLIGKYPYRIYNRSSDNKYIAIFQHVIPFMRKRLEFKSGDVVKASGLLWKDEAYRINKKKTLLILTHFRRPIDLEEMITNPYDKSAAQINKRRSRML